jgi:hypothetical protein
MQTLNDVKVIFNPFSENKLIYSQLIKMLKNLVYIDNKIIDKTKLSVSSTKINEFITEELIKE